MDQRIVIGIVVAVIIVIAVVYVQQEKQVVPESVSNNAQQPATPQTSDVATPITPPVATTTAPTPTIALLTNPVVSADPNWYYTNGATDPKYLITQDAGKTLDNDINSLWFPYFDANVTSRPSAATYDFGVPKYISRVVLKSGYFDPNWAQDWATVQIVVDGALLGTFTNNNVKIPMPAGGNGTHYTENSIDINKTCQKIQLRFVNDEHRLREVQFYGY